MHALAGVVEREDLHVLGGIAVDPHERGHAVALRRQDRFAGAAEGIERIEDCWTSDSYTLAQAFTVSPGPVVIGELSIADPVLTTTCGADLMLQSDDVIVGFE